jgi:hypothetical protein
MKKWNDQSSIQQSCHSNCIAYLYALKGFFYKKKKGNKVNDMNYKKDDLTINRPRAHSDVAF